MKGHTVARRRPVGANPSIVAVTALALRCDYLLEMGVDEYPNAVLWRRIWGEKST